MKKIRSADWLAQERELMVERQIRTRGVGDAAVIDAMLTVPRERFVAEELAGLAYDDTPLRIGSEQTISQPYMVAVMAQALHLRPQGRVLEIGTGSGYGAAVLSRIAGKVISIERHQSLADSARQALAELHYDNVTVIHGDGTLGFPTEAPFDGIVVTAGAPAVPESLLEQLAEGGSLVIPVGSDQRAQSLLRVTRRGDHFDQENLGGVRFVPLIGVEGWGTDGITRR